MLVLLYGISCSGKTFIQRKLINKYNFKPIKCYVTRNLREDDINRVQVDVDEFKRLEDNGEIEIKNELYGNLYGASRKDLEKSCNSEEFYILDFSIQNFEKIIHYNPINLIINIEKEEFLLNNILTSKRLERKNEILNEYNKFYTLEKRKEYEKAGFFIINNTTNFDEEEIYNISLNVYKKYISQELKHYSHNIYYISPSNTIKPKSIKYNNMNLIRVLNFIYISKNMEDLTKDEILCLNYLRLKFKHNEKVYKLNTDIKILFTSIINIINPNSLIDYGCGFDPITNYFKYNGKFYPLDFDITLKTLTNKCLFIYKSLDEIKETNIDLIISIFVLHFKISENEIKSMYNKISDNGLIIGNIYNRTNKSIQELKHKFIKNSFLILEYNLSTKQNHKLWIVYKIDIEKTILSKLENFIYLFSKNNNP